MFCKLYILSLFYCFRHCNVTTNNTIETYPLTVLIILQCVIIANSSTTANICGFYSLYWLVCIPCRSSSTTRRRWRWWGGRWNWSRSGHRCVNFHAGCRRCGNTAAVLICSSVNFFVVCCCRSYRFSWCDRQHESQHQRKHNCQHSHRIGGLARTPRLVLSVIRRWCPHLRRHLIVELWNCWLCFWSPYAVKFTFSNRIFGGLIIIMQTLDFD